MGNGQLTENFMPSEVARLVLGYLKETGCVKSWQAFLSESSHLCEYQVLYKEGKEYPTNVCGKSLLKILQHYYIVNSKDSQVEIRHAAQQTDQHAFNETECITITSVSLPVNVNEGVNQVNFKQTDRTNAGHEHRQASYSQFDQHKTCSVVQTKERMLPHSFSAVSLSNAEVSPMDISEMNNCSDIMVSTCASSCQAKNVSTESISKQLPISHCQKYNYSTASSFQPPQTTAVSTVNSSQSAFLTQCHQQGLCPQIGATTFSNHSCQFSTTVTSQSATPLVSCTNTIHKNGTTPYLSKKLPIQSLHNKNSTVVASVGQNMSTALEGVSSLANTENIGGISGMNSEKGGNCKNSSSSTAASHLSLESNICDHINTTIPSLRLSNTVDVGPNRTIEYSPHTFLTHQRLLPSLNTPMKELSDFEDYFCSPKRKSLLPRRRLLSSFSPAQLSAPGNRVTEDIEPPTEEISDYNVLMEEFFKCTPLLEKIAENINKVVSTEQNQMAPTEKQIMDSDLPIPAQVSHNQESMIRDIVTRTESDPAFEELLNSLCEKVDSSKDGFENANTQNGQSESNRGPSIVQQTQSLEQTEVVHCSVSSMVEENTTRKENIVFENAVKERTTQTDNIISSSTVMTSNTVTVQQNIIQNNTEKNKSNSPSNTGKVTENCINSSVAGNNKEKTLVNHIESTVSTNLNRVLQNEQLTTTQNTSSVALVTDLSGNIIHAITENSLVLPTSSTPVNSNTLIPDTRQSVALNPSFQFLTISPRQLYGTDTSVSLSARKAPSRFQPISCKPLASSVPASVTRNSFVNGNTNKPVNRIPRDMVRRNPLKHIKPNILNTPAMQGQVAEHSNNNNTASSSLQSNLCNSSSTVRTSRTQMYNTNNTMKTPESKTRSKIEPAEKTSPRLKSLVSSAQTLAGSAFFNKTHKRALDFGAVANTANQTASSINYEKSKSATNQMETLPTDIKETTQQNNQVTLAVDNLFEGIINNGEIIIYLESPGVITSEGIVTIPLNSEQETVPAYLSYTVPETNSGLAANTDIIIVPSGTPNTEAQSQIVTSQETANNDSEIAETLVKLASSIPDSEHASNKSTDSAQKDAASTITKKLKRPIRKRDSKPKRRKLEDVLRQGMDIDKFLSRLNYEK